MSRLDRSERWSADTWPTQTAPVDFVEKVLRLEMRQPATRGFAAKRTSPPFRLAIVAGVLFLGAAAAALSHRSTSFVTQPALDATTLGPSRAATGAYVRFDSRLDTASSERSTGAPQTRPRSTFTSVSPTLTAPSSTLAPHYPPCHCGPGGVVCSCVE